MRTDLTKHWAVCLPDGTIAYEWGVRAHIYGSRQDARDALPAARIEHGKKLRIDAVEIADFKESA